MSIEETCRSTVFSKEFPGYQGQERTANKCVIETRLLICRTLPASCPGDDGCHHSDVPRLSSTLGEDRASVYLLQSKFKRDSMGNSKKR